MNPLYFLFLCFSLLTTEPTGFVRLNDFPGEERDDALALYHEGSIYAGTGYASGFYALRDWWRYDLSSGTWEQLADLPFSARQYSSLIAADDYLYLMGGFYDKHNFFNDFWRYNPLTDVWEKMADLPGPKRWSARMVFIDGMIFGGLGNDTSRHFSDWYQYLPSTDSWEKKADFPGTGISRGVAFEFASTAIVGLGRNQLHSYNNFWQYLPHNDLWQIFPLKLDDSLTYPAWAVNGDKLYLLGGQTPDGSYISEGYEIDLLAHKWKKYSSGLGKRRGANLIYGEEKLYLLWGLEEDHQRIKTFHMADLKHSDCKLEVFPNPFKNFIKVSFPLGTDRIELYELSGQLVKSWPVEYRNYIILQNLNLSNRAYLIRSCRAEDCEEAKLIFRD